MTESDFLQCTNLLGFKVNIYFQITVDTPMRSVREALEMMQHNLKIPGRPVKEREENGKAFRFTDDLRNTGDQDSQDSNWAKEKEWAQRILQHLIEIRQPFKLDRLTRGNGSCLMIGLM